MTAEAAQMEWQPDGETGRCGSGGEAGILVAGAAEEPWGKESQEDVRNLDKSAIKCSSSCL